MLQSSKVSERPLGAASCTGRAHGLRLFLHQVQPPHSLVPVFVHSFILIHLASNDWTPPLGQAHRNDPN